MSSSNHLSQKTVKIGQFSVGNNLPFVFIAGPCQIESAEHSVMIASELQRICSKLSIPYIFKSSFDKANRTSVRSKRGIPIEESLQAFQAVKETVGCQILTDIHKESQCELLARYVDVLQIPALLCRQTDLLQAAAATGKVVNIKKGQFLDPWSVSNIVEKMEFFGNSNCLLTERGASFGYNNLVLDMRSLYIMSETGYPVICDITHALQYPGRLGESSGGDRRFAEVLARSAIASTPIAGIFMEVHQDPDRAPSDGPCMLPLDRVEAVLSHLKKIDLITKSLVKLPEPADTSAVAN